MSKRFGSQQEIDAFLKQPRLAILMYHGGQDAPTGVPVWFDWNGATLQMFSSRTSPKVQRLRDNSSISVLVTNAVGEAEGWVAFDGMAEISDFSQQNWSALLDRVAPRYWDLNDSNYATQIKSWHTMPDEFVSLTVKPQAIRSGA